MKDFMHDGIATNRPYNSMDIYLKELGSESPRVVYLINRSIYKNDKRIIKHIGSKRFEIQYLLKRIYTHNNLLYLHNSIKNSTFTIDKITIPNDKQLVIELFEKKGGRNQTFVIVIVNADLLHAKEVNELKVK